MLRKIVAVVGNRRIDRRAVAASTVLATVVSFATAIVVAVPNAAADTAPPVGSPATVSADPLPTWQIDGVVYSQVTVGATVYATGSFSFARPPGAPVGAPSQVARKNLLAYNIATGNLVTSFNHSLNGVGRAITASPDGSRVYVAGDFTSVDGTAHSRVAAFDTTTGALVTSFAATVNNTVRAVTATNTAAYVGGDFTIANGNTATHLAALSATNGASLSWNATANGSVTALQMAPDLSRVVVAGRFTTLDASPYYGIGAVDAVTGAGTPWSSAFPIKNAGPNASITDLIADGTNVYGTAYDFGSGGNFEGRFAVDPYTGNLRWLDSCHGDSYSLAILGSVIYSASHAHDCSDGSSFDQSQNFARVQAETIDATGIAAHNNDTGNANYHDFGGQPTNTLLTWSPTLAPGTFTGEAQAAWSVTAGAQYVAFGGEFPTVDGVAQQGLVRFAIPSLAPNKVKPVSRGSFTPQASSVLSGTVQVRWLGTYDQDNANLTYQVFRDDGTTPIYTTTAVSDFYQQPELSYLDTGLTPGTTHTYKVRVGDPFNNGFPSFPSNSVTVASSGARTSYETAVTGDGATNFWPLSESSGTLANDHIGGNDLSLVSISDVTRGVPGPPVAGSASATAFDGTSSGSGATIGGGVPQPNVSVEAWIKTTTAGGQIVDYGLSGAHASAISTDSLYLNNTGRLYFAVWTAAGYRSVNSTAAVTDGAWHHIVGTLSTTDGAKLYLDGSQVAADPTLTTSRQILGYWRVGGDRVDFLPSAPSTSFYTGAIADVAVYPRALSAAEMVAHAAGSGVVNRAPVAAFTASCTALHCVDDGSTSSDPDGTVADWDWDFGDGTTGRGSVATHTYTDPGNYLVKVTVTDNDGLTDVISHTTTVTANQPPVAAFTSTCTLLACSVDATASSDPQGPVASYVWNFGDGTTATGPTANHSYPIAGDYPVTLTVADSGTPALTNALTKTVVVRPAADPVVFANDTFNRTVSNGLGTADVGGPWSTSYVPSTLAVTPGAAAMTLPTAGTSSGARLASVLRSDTDTTATMTINKQPTGSGTFLYLVGRYLGFTTQYRGRVRVASSGALSVALTMLNGSSTETTIVPDTAVPGITFTAGMKLNLRLQVVGTNSTVLRFKVWPQSSSEPSSWQITATDATAALQQPGSVGFVAFMFANATNAPQKVSVSSFAATPSHAPPTAAIISSCTQLACTVDGTGSAGSSALGYAWSFGDGASAATAAPSHNYTQGGTYRITLTVTDREGYTNVTTKTITLNSPPVAAFTPTCASALACTFDASNSIDPDGTLTSISWDFGDGSTGSGRPAAHTYAVANTYTVSLTVTDDAGAHTTVTHAVTVPPPNQPPIASFVVTCVQRTCTMDGSASTDPDGTIAGYSWDLGDGTTASGASASRTYPIAGDYPVTLTVTDNRGATGRVTHTATTTPVPNPLLLAQDSFQRTVANGMGTADVGGQWTANNLPGDLAVTPGAGLLTMRAAAATVGARLAGVSSTDVDVTATVSLNKLATGSGTFFYLEGRRIGPATEYRGRLKVLSSTEMLVSIVRVTTADPTGTAIAVDKLIPLRYAAGMQMNLHLQVTGTNPTTLRFSAWKSGTAEPATWQVSTTDSTAELQRAGSPGIATYLYSNAINAPVTASVTSFAVSRGQTPPTAAFTASCSVVAGTPRCGVDASASTDAQGPIASYAWSFGDGATATTATPTTAHTYTATGTYRITLTVTDSIGFTAFTRQTVVVDTPPVASFFGNCTGTTCTFDGTTSADPGGTIVGYTWDFGDGFNGSGATVTHTFAAADAVTVTLTVTGQSGLTASTSQGFLGTGNKRPTSSFVVVCQALACSFDGSTSSDPDGTVVRWAWNFGDGATGTGEFATHTYAAASRVTTTLTVTDDDGATGTSTFIVQTRAPNLPPTASFTFTCAAGHACTFDARGSSDSDGTVVNWTWDFGDGATSNGQVVAHTYANANPVTVRLTVTDSDEATDTTTRAVSPG